MKKIKILKFITDSALKSVIEKDHFIYDKAALYCVRDGCDGCKYKPTCSYDETPGLEAHLNKSTRNNIKFGVPTDLSNWYLPNIEKAEDLEYVKLSNSRYIPTVPLSDLPKDIKERLVLSESFKNVYKKVLSIKDHDLTKIEDHLLFNPDDLKYYCIRSNCKSCEYFSKCENEIEVSEKRLVYVAIDSSAQEPMIVTYLSEEPEYIKIFTNHSIDGKISYILEPLAWLFENYYKVKTFENPEYLSFIDYLAFEDKTKLYNFSSAVYEYISGAMSEEDLVDSISYIDEVYSEFKTKVKKGEIVFHKIRKD